MRRNAPARRGGPNLSGGPLLTEHLMDLDLELELLKRKREMIEKQHQQLYAMPQFKTQSQYANYEQPRSYNQQPFGSNRDFSHLYNDGPSYGGQSGRKRQADPIWEHGAQPQMYPSKKKPIQSIFGSRLGPKPGQAGPSSAGPASVRFQKPQPNAVHNPKFNMSPLMNVKFPIGQKSNKGPLLKTPGLSKVSKPKRATAPNNLASNPVAERAVFVAEALKSSAAVDEAIILREDRKPTPQMNGRLELALGMILREMKDRYGKTLNYGVLFNTTHSQRVIKQKIREGIRGVMMGKVVGITGDIKRQYREKFPEETDVDILNLALGTKHEVEPDTKRVESDIKNTAEYNSNFKTNMYNLMDAKLRELIAKFREMHEKERQDKTGEKILEEIDIADDDADATNDESTSDGTRAYRLATRLLPRLLKTYHRTFVYLLGIDDIYLEVKESMVNKDAGAGQKQTGGANTPDGDSMSGQQTSLFNAMPYYVKIKSKPTLPKKKIMREFLSRFNTKTIKKHKTVHNLLFVGFTEKSDYDNMLAATGTAIGRSVLEITPSEKAAPKPSPEENDVLNTSLDKIISPELDGQITDLLTSIRQAEEEEDKTEDDEKPQENGEKMDTGDDKPLRNEGSDDNAPAIKLEVTETFQTDEVNQDEFTEAKSAVQVKSEIATEDNQNQSENLQENVKTDNDANGKQTDSSSRNSEDISESPENVSDTLVTVATEKIAVTPGSVSNVPEIVAATPEKLVNAPAKVAETPAKVAATPAKEAATPAKVAEAPTKAAATPAKVAATPAKVAATPAKVAATPTKAAATLAKVAVTPGKAATTPVKVAEAPTKAAATPAKVAATPAKVAATPAKVAATPAKVAATPAKVAATTAKVAVAPVKIAATAAKIVATPAKGANTPVKVADTPEKVAATPAKAASTPAKVSNAPTNVAGKPANVAATPSKVAATPAKLAATPTKLAGTPAKVAETPAKVAATPAKVPNVPAKVAETPSNVAAIPAKVAATPAKVAATPAKVAATPAKEAATPAKVAATPRKVAATPAKIAEIPAKVDDKPEKIAEPSAEVPESSEKAVESLEKVAEPLNNVVEGQKAQENLDVDGEKSDTVAELKIEAKETGRSTPTRMTRSANVTPSTIRTRRASRLAQNQ